MPGYTPRPLTTKYKPVPNPVSYLPGTAPSDKVYLGNSGSGSGAIQFPDFYSLGQGVQDIKSAGVLPDSKPLTGFGDDYYNNLYNQSQKRLSDQYFTGANNLQDRLKNQMNKRGLIGSGIEAGATTDLYKDFGSQMADQASQLATQRAENDLNLADKNRDFGAKISELTLRGAADAQENATNYGTKLFQSQVEAQKQGVDREDKILRTLTELFNSPKAGDTQRGNTRADIQRILDQYFTR